jgi:hypothetical protein
VAGHVKGGRQRALAEPPGGSKENGRSFDLYGRRMDRKVTPAQKAEPCRKSPEALFSLNDVTGPRNGNTGAFRINNERPHAGDPETVQFSILIQACVKWMSWAGQPFMQKSGLTPLGIA